MFDVNFYPTSEETLDDVLRDEVIEGKVILEPQSGKADIVKRLLKDGAKEVLGCELHPELYKISASYCKMIGTDFLKITSEQISHIDMIVMNPPFDMGGWHLLHAFKIAPDGCKIICLLNYQTIDNPHTKARKELIEIIKTHGQYENLGDCFSTAERKTNIDVALVKIQKPFSNNGQEFEGFFEDEDEEEEQSNGIMSYNAIRELVARYVQSIKIFDEQLETAVRLNTAMGDCFDDTYAEGGYVTTSRYSQDASKISTTVNQNGVPVKREEFKKRIQKSGWRWIFKKMNLEKYSTRGLKDDINKFVEEQINIPFTMRNIYKMLELVVATTGQRMDKAIIEVFDKVTRHTHDNRFNVEGFKTNSEYLLTKKFIFSYACEPSYSGGKIRLRKHDGDCATLMDMEKALCFLTGKNWDEINPPYESDHTKQKPQKGIWGLDLMEPGEWYDTEFFRVKGFKKQTIHVEFVREDDWAIFNQNIARIKGYPLPEKKEKTAYQKRQTYDKPVEKMAA